MWPAINSVVRLHGCKGHKILPTRNWNYDSRPSPYRHHNGLCNAIWFWIGFDQEIYGENCSMDLLWRRSKFLQWALGFLDRVWSITASSPHYEQMYHQLVKLLEMYIIRSYFTGFSIPFWLWIIKTKKYLCFRFPIKNASLCKSFFKSSFSLSFHNFYR